MLNETYRPDQFKPDEIEVEPTNVFEEGGSVNANFRPDYTDEGISPIQAATSSSRDQNPRWVVRGDLGDLSGRGKPSNGNKWPGLSRIAVITTAREEFPRNA